MHMGSVSPGVHFQSCPYHKRNPTEYERTLVVSEIDGHFHCLTCKAKGRIRYEVKGLHGEMTVPVMELTGE